MNRKAISFIVTISSTLMLFSGQIAAAVTDSANVFLTVDCAGINCPGGGGGDSGSPPGQQDDDATDQDGSGGGGGGGGEPPGGDTLPPVGPGFASSAGVDIFEFLPEGIADDVLLDQLTLNDFLFLQDGRSARRLFAQNIIQIDGRQNLFIQLDYRKVPAVLKTIGFTVFDAADSQKTFSFLLRADDARGGYTARLGPFARNGLYPFNIHVIDHENRRVKKLTGSFQVVGASLPALSSLLAPLAGRLNRLALGSGILAGASALLAAAPGAATLYDFYLIAIRGLGAIFGALRTRKQRRPWGTVYDAVTKQPLDPALISVLKNGREVASAITDIDGRYGLVLPPGEYEIKVKKSNYRFPSRLLAGRNEDEIYSNLYFGNKIMVSGEEVTTLNIPLDPTDFDWNTFFKDRSRFLKFYKKRERFQFRFFNILYTVGFLISLSLVIGAPSYLNFTIFATYLVLYFLQKSFKRFRYRTLTLRRLGTAEAIPFALVKVFLSGIDQLVKTIITDGLGQFYLLVRPGTYYFVIEEKKPDGSYERVHKSEPVVLEKGVLSGDLIIP